MGNALGDQLREVRRIRGLSLKAVAEPAKISIAYLQKLEGGEAKVGVLLLEPVNASAAAASALTRMTTSPPTPMQVGGGYASPLAVK